jgi:hypothetical protein
MSWTLRALFRWAVRLLLLLWVVACGCLPGLDPKWDTSHTRSLLLLPPAPPAVNPKTLEASGRLDAATTLPLGGYH